MRLNAMPRPSPGALARSHPTAHLGLANALGEGLYQARMASQCLTGAGQDSQRETVVQLLAYLSTAIERLQVARGIVQRWA